MNGQTVTRYSVPKQQIQQAIYKYTHKKVAKVTRGGRYAATWKTDTIIEEGQCIKDQPRTRRVEKCRAQCKEPTYEDLIVFDRPTHEVEDEIKAVEKNESTKPMPTNILGWVGEEHDERWHVRVDGSEKK